MERTKTKQTSMRFAQRASSVFSLASSIGRTFATFSSMVLVAEGCTAFDCHCNSNKKDITWKRINAKGRRKMEISVIHSHRQSVQKIRTLTRCDEGKRLSSVSLLESRSHLT